MKDEVRSGLVSLYGKAIPAIEQRDVLKLRAINKEAIDTASLYQDEDSLAAAIIIYSSMKIIERDGFNVKPLKVLVYHLLRHLERDKDAAYRREIRKVFSLISRLDRNLKMFMEEVVKQARVKKGGSLHEHGLSIGQAASLLGVSQWELMSYVGKTSLSESYPGKISEGNRMETARRLFR